MSVIGIHLGHICCLTAVFHKLKSSTTLTKEMSMIASLHCLQSILIMGINHGTLLSMLCIAPTMTTLLKRLKKDFQFNCTFRSMLIIVLYIHQCVSVIQFNYYDQCAIYYLGKKACEVQKAPFGIEWLKHMEQLKQYTMKNHSTWYHSINYA